MLLEPFIIFGSSITSNMTLDGNPFGIHTEILKPWQARNEETY